MSYNYVKLIIPLFYIRIWYYLLIYNPQKNNEDKKFNFVFHTIIIVNLKLFQVYNYVYNKHCQQGEYTTYDLTLGKPKFYKFEFNFESMVVKLKYLLELILKKVFWNSKKLWKNYWKFPN